MKSNDNHDGHRLYASVIEVMAWITMFSEQDLRFALAKLKEADHTGEDQTIKDINVTVVRAIEDRLHQYDVEAPIVDQARECRVTHMVGGGRNPNFERVCETCHFFQRDVKYSAHGWCLAEINRTPLSSGGYPPSVTINGGCDEHLGKETIVDPKKG